MSTGTTGATSPQAPSVTAITSQPLSGSAEIGGASSGGVTAGGALAPSPSLFSDENPLAGVLPGSVFDPFVNAAIGTDVPQWFVENFDVPSFLLPIYQAAGAAYDVPWEVLAAINQVETNFGSNLDVSSAGAVGWMQFMPATWAGYGVDATGSGVEDPYNAADAIFAAAKYLNAAGASINLPAAIFAYNHSTAYVQSVLLRAELLSGVPSTLVDSVSELSEGLFPIELRYHPHYGTRERPGGSATLLAASSGTNGEAPAPDAVGASVDGATTGGADATAIYARAHAATVAVQDGTVIAIGHNRRLGRFVKLEDSFGNVYTYGNLGSYAAYHLVAKRQPAAASSSLAVPAALSSGPAPTAPASAGTQASGGINAAAAAEAEADQLGSATASATRDVARTAASEIASPFAAFDFRPGLTDDTTIFGGPRIESARQRAASLRAARASMLVDRYFTSAFGLARDELEPRPLRVGSHVRAGTILGHLAARDAHLIFELRPAGAAQAPIDPRPFLDAWAQLATLELHRQPLAAPVYGPELQPDDAG
ncbi:MAG TPA: lytic murein transglycosylase, partial [Solirubrobacteraceae bacterium]|nr:lytic murein transglycosylase [Solirubrobacteraceae bacterium]